MLNIKPSKFIKDFINTGLTQILVILFNIILLRIMASALSKEYFGVFTIIRRILGVSIPLVTFNLAVGIARYVSFDSKNERKYLNTSFWAVLFMSSVVSIIFYIFNNKLAILFFKTNDFKNFILPTAILILSYAIYTLSYAFFRGRQEMHKANKMHFYYYVFPLIICLILWAKFKENYYNILVFYLILFSLWGLFLGSFFIRDYLDVNYLFHIIRRIKSVKKLFFYSLYRIPSGFFLALIFGTPVFIATHNLSLIDAGYLGIVVAIIRLLEIFVTPFNLLFLPKFAKLKKNLINDVVTRKVHVVINFIFTVLPFIAVIMYGLAKYIIILFFNQKYLIVTQSVSVIILFSIFYLSYVLIRGILDGLFFFPYVNVLCCVGFLSTVIISYFFHNTILHITLSFGIGLLVMGSMSLFILIKKVRVSIKFKEIFIPLVIALLIFTVLFFIDKSLKFFCFSEYLKLVIKIFYRIIIAIIFFWFYCKPKCLWAKELLARI